MAEDQSSIEEPPSGPQPSGVTSPVGSDDLPTRIASDRSLGASSTTLTLPKPESVLRKAEIEQTRRTALAGLVFTTAAMLGVVFFGGDPTARWLYFIGLVLSDINNGWLLYIASSEERYAPRHVLVYFALAPFFNACIIYYVGVFGPIVVVFLLNIYTACLGYDRRIARVTLAGSVLPPVALGVPMAAGWIRDPGLMSVSDYAGNPARVMVLVLLVLFFFVVYAQARNTRELMVASLIERDEAVRRASHREALFLEARQDLERALQAGGLGRFTDQTLGSYRLGGVIGRGGMGEIYEATHVDTGEPAAVKMLLPEVLSRPDYVRRFMREVRIAASVRSPHVARVLEVGDEKAPLPYLAMERLHGDDLAQILRQQERLAPSAVLDLLRQVGHGLRAAAEAGIVHRDLKPQNLFCTSSEKPVWKILDFGVSKLTESSATLTQGETIGTPQYMAPEQARGADVDKRADLYALGAIAYRALTGHQPFKAGDLAEVLFAVLGQMPLRPSALVRLPRDVDLALAIALAKKPEDRFESPQELADAMQQAIAGRLDTRHRKHATELLAHLPWAEPT